MGIVISSFRSNREARREYNAAKENHSRIAEEVFEDKILYSGKGEEFDKALSLRLRLADQSPDQWQDAQQMLGFVWVLYYRNRFIRPVLFRFRTYWYGWKPWLWYFIIALVVVVFVAYQHYHDKLVEFVQENKQAIIDVPASFLIPVILLIIASLPIAGGHEFILLLTGVIWPLGLAMAISIAGLLLGELVSYYLTISFGFKKAHQMASTKLFAACIYHMLSGEAKPEPNAQGAQEAQGAVVDDSKWRKKRRQFGMMMLIRLSVVPGHLSTPVFAICDIGVVIFLAGCVLTLPEQLVFVYFGSLLAKGDDSTQSHFIQNIILAITLVITLVAGVILLAAYKNAIPIVCKRKWVPLSWDFMRELKEDIIRRRDAGKELYGTLKECADLQQSDQGKDFPDLSVHPRPPGVLAAENKAYRKWEKLKKRWEVDERTWGGTETEKQTEWGSSKEEIEILDWTMNVRGMFDKNKRHFSVWLVVWYSLITVVVAAGVAVFIQIELHELLLPWLQKIAYTIEMHKAVVIAPLAILTFGLVTSCFGVTYEIIGLVAGLEFSLLEAVIICSLGVVFGEVVSILLSMAVWRRSGKRQFDDKLHRAVFKSVVERRPLLVATLLGFSIVPTGLSTFVIWSSKRVGWNLITSLVALARVALMVVVGFLLTDEIHFKLGFILMWTVLGITVVMTVVTWCYLHRLSQLALREVVVTKKDKWVDGLKNEMQTWKVRKRHLGWSEERLEAAIKSTEWQERVAKRLMKNG